MGFWGDFQGLTEATGGGRGVKKSKIETTSFIDGPLDILMFSLLSSLIPRNLYEVNYNHF